MSFSIKQLIENLNNDSESVRLEALSALMDKIQSGEVEKPITGTDVNNHIHTWYSFSPYSPTKAVWMAYTSGLATAGIMDHDSVSGALEFMKAGKIAGIATTTGVECRVDFSDTPLNGKKINNPDQDSIAYVALHGIPYNKITEVTRFFAPYLGERNIRNRRMTARLNELLSPFDISIDFDKEVVPLSKSDKGGSITERHIMFALSLKLIAIFGKNKRLLSFLAGRMKLNISSKIEKALSDPCNEFYEYDLLGLLKSDLVPLFYIDASSECPDIRDIIRLSKRIGAISAYAYLGDISDSITGDKRAQHFEDSYLELLFETLKNLEFKAVTYMPSRNTLEQLTKVKTYCKEYGFFEISGEDINSPRQLFICQAQRNEVFKNLYDSTWALIGHESEASKDIEKGMFSHATLSKLSNLNERITVFKNIGERQADSYV
jgi:hypothetical protein